ncbi:transcriptional regulator [Desulfocucumis palustris]|uniref:Transcriptional regulator n=1 Tax=Desulfocucumis palustris TaxID=1898651 RepID=A0A2L2XFU0_9FIRM|nr:PadR family transcriptional regulator [Desulfocucumis palustris]GBF35085.1 transcriptional regulator [Desulfocucumis palustris]
MSGKSKKSQVYRYTPAFILLFLSRENLYGAALFNRMHSEIPFCHADGAVVYRTLQELEEVGAVKSYWETGISGPAKKWYQITGQGLELLAKFAEDIDKSKKNLEFFLAAYKQKTGQL